MVPDDGDDALILHATQGPQRCDKLSVRGGAGLLHAVGFDLGTSGLKAVLADEAGQVIRTARRSYPLQTPLAGWTEQDPEVWWQALLVTCRTLLEGGMAPDAVGLTGQMHSAVVLDAQQGSLHPAILWNDQRTIRECAEIRERFGDAMAGWTGNHIRTAFTASKNFWLRPATIRTCTPGCPRSCCRRTF